MLLFIPTILLSTILVLEATMDLAGPVHMWDNILDMDSMESMDKSTALITKNPLYHQLQQDSTLAMLIQPLISMELLNKL